MTRRTFFVASTLAAAPDGLALENQRLRLSFDATSGALREVWNKMTGEAYRVAGDEFSVETTEEWGKFSDFKLETREVLGGVLRLAYRADRMRVEVSWTLGARHGFAEKRVWLTPERACGLKSIVLSRLQVVAPGLEVVCYRHPDYAGSRRSFTDACIALRHRADPYVLLPHAQGWRLHWRGDAV